MGLMDGCVPGSRRAAILGADKCQKRGGQRRRARAAWASPPNVGASENRPSEQPE